MACAVETVTTNFVIFIPFVWYCVHICFSWHCCVENCVEYYNVWNVCTEYSFCAVETKNVCWVVQWCDCAKTTDFCNNFIINKCGFLEAFCAVSNTVTDSGNFFYVIDNFAFACCHHFNNFCECFCVCWEWNFYCPFAIVSFVFDKAAFNTDSFADTFADNAFIFHVDELIFKGAGTTVDYQNFHFNQSSN